MTTTLANKLATSFLFLGLVSGIGGCASSPTTAPKESGGSINSAQIVSIPSPVSSDQVSNPVEIIRQAGATPDNGAIKGEYSADGNWYAMGKFPASPENAQVGAYTQFTVKSFPNRAALEKALSQNPDAVSDDSHKVLVGKDRHFYAVIIGIAGDGGTTFDVDPTAVATRINASLRP